MAMRRLLLLSRALASTTTSSVASSVHCRFLSTGGNTANSGSHSRRSAGAISVGFAGGLAAVASLSFQEVYAKEPLPANLVPKEVVLYLHEGVLAAEEVKAFLDYYDIPYKVKEYNPASWPGFISLFKQRPLSPVMMVGGEQLVGSSVIIDKLARQIIPEKTADSASENDEETEWLRWLKRSWWLSYSITYFGMLLRLASTITI
ncbi:prostaglandin E synthase 2-like [Mangifera indica]|uniref:prostaglandin E synthase 2-like n=1 Tax=Mangifera indica TaxID=29780 RepID=UPI001CFC359F|nr:prostaglandin E synthase 2-like [Mangifera indica]